MFGGGDCITIDKYEKEPYFFPPKAGVYAVRSGPILAKNIAAFANKIDMTEYVPQTEFLALLALGNGTAVGTKFGISFTGKWVWKMKDYIDVGFMNLFNKKFLFKDFETKGYSEPVPENMVYEEERAEIRAKTDPIKERVNSCTPEEAGAILSVGEDNEEFWEQLFTIDRMGRDADFAAETVKHFKPTYKD